jgi:transposase InsO family protein
VVGQRDSAKKEKTFKVKWLYQCFGISKQAYYKRLSASQAKDELGDRVIEWVIQIRRRQKRLGGKKLYDMLQDRLREHSIKMGRDKLFDLLRSRGMLVRRTKRFHITNDSKHHFYKSPNRIKDLRITHAEQVVVCDNTYVSTDQGHAYLALVTDAYSKQIMGYHLANHMKASLCTEALAMAVRNRSYPDMPLIHHSDRGFQYCSAEYVKFAEDHRMTMSMTEQYDPYENAVAERVNRTLKYEFGLKMTIKDFSLAKKMVTHGVHTYNTHLLH